MDDDERRRTWNLMEANAAVLGIEIPQHLKAETVEVLDTILKASDLLSHHLLSAETELAPVYRA